MKALIIENEYSVDITVLAFLKDNPTLFTNVQGELYCLHRDTQELLQHILNNDAIIIYSTFMYKDQLMDFLDALTSPDFPKKDIYVHDIVRHLNDWISDGYFKEPEIVDKVKLLLNKGFNLYSFFSDYTNDEFIEDELNSSYKMTTRFKYTYKKVYYDEKQNKFLLND